MLFRSTRASPHIHQIPPAEAHQHLRRARHPADLQSERAGLRIRERRFGTRSPGTAFVSSIVSISGNSVFKHVVSMPKWAAETPLYPPSPFPITRRELFKVKCICSALERRHPSRACVAKYYFLQYKSVVFWLEEEIKRHMSSFIKTFYAGNRSIV